MYYIVWKLFGKAIHLFLLLAIGAQKRRFVSSLTTGPGRTV